MGSRVQHRFGQAYQFVQDLLCPNWRWMSILVGTWCMFEASRDASPPYGRLSLWQGLATVSLCVVAFMLFWAAAQPTMPLWMSNIWRKTPDWLKWRGWRGGITVLLIINSWLIFTYHVSDLVDGQYHTDALAFVHIDADLLLHGKNPYTSNDAFWIAELRWPESLATPMMNGPIFGSNPLKYPENSTMNNWLQYEAKNPQARTTDLDPTTAHNYPAGILWLVLPLVWAGVPSILWVNFLFFAGMLWLLLAGAERKDRPAITMLMLFSPVILDYLLFGNFDFECIFFVLAAWHWMPKSRASAILFGVACAVKQLAWFIAPFYLVEVARREGWREAFKRTGWMLATFAVINLPFIIASPIAWFHSILVPMTDPMFPLGYGPITLALSQLIPFGSAHLWTLLVALITLGLLYFQWKRPAITRDGIFLGLVPLWFSWRSPMNYLVLIPILAAWVGIQQIADARRAKEQEAALASEVAEITAQLDAVPAQIPELAATH